MPAATTVHEHHDQIFIGGQFVPSHATGTIEVTNPSTEQIIGHVPAGTESDVDDAVQAAHAALPGWAALTPARRGWHLRALGEALLHEDHALAQLISAEVGTPFTASLDVQVHDPVKMLDAYAQAATQVEWESRNRTSVIVREPVGVVAVITPWNYPLYSVIAKVGAALAAGCTTVVKPSELAPLNAYYLAQAARDSGLPAGVLNIVMGTGPHIGEALVTHPLVRMVTFTGSTRAGRRVAALAARSPKPAVLELGGKSAAIVLDDADLDDVIPRAVADCYRNAGQTCSARTRLLVPASLADRAADLAAQAALATPVDIAAKSGRHIGPLISAEQRDKVRDHILGALKQGARLRAGGIEPPEGLERGFFVRPTVLDQVTTTMEAARQEIFGPVLCLLTHHGDDDAVRIANDSPYGLSAAVWSGDPARARGVAQQLDTGEVYINRGRFNIHAPFGGIKESGYGREFGPDGIAEFTYLKALHT